MEELTSEECRELKEDLLRLLEELARLLELSREGAQPVDLETPIGRLSRMDAMQHQQMAAANRQSHQLRFGQVKQALGAIDNGEYGDCRRCEEPIGLRRLKARPETPFCLACQGAVERN